MIALVSHVGAAETIQPSVVGERTQLQASGGFP